MESVVKLVTKHDREFLNSVKSPTLLRGCLLTLLEATHGLVTVWNTKGRLLYMNAVGRSMLGIDQGSYLVGRKISDFYAPAAYEQLRGGAIPICLRLGIWHGETTLVDRQGAEIPVSQVLISNRVNHDGRDINVVSGIAWDMREQKETEHRLRHDATHDALTGLPNRTLFMDRLDQALRRAERHGSHVGLLFIDLDGFKDVNDTYGHETGNLVLRELGQRLQSRVRGEDTIARYGGDEFVLIVPDLPAAGDVKRSREEVRDALELPVLVGDKRIRLHASVGVAIYPDDAQDVQKLIHAADSRMYETKKGCKGSGDGLSNTQAPPKRVAKAS